MAYRIQEVAQKCHLSTYSIRYYHDHGMLPFVQRDAHNNRVFHDIDLEWLNLIKCLRQTGMPLKRIRHYLDLVQQGDTTIPERYAIMQAQQAQAQQELAPRRPIWPSSPTKSITTMTFLPRANPTVSCRKTCPQPSPFPDNFIINNY